MPVVRFKAGEVVMGRWPGSSLYYEVKVLKFDAKTQLYTVIYKDGTELELEDVDVKSLTTFKQATSRSRSRSRSPARTRRSRSRSPARTTRRSSSRTTDARKEKIRESQVRLMPLALPFENNSSNNKHEKKEDYEAANNEKTEAEPENQTGGRYNLRRRKDQEDGKQLELEKKEEVTLAKATPQEAGKTTKLEFGGRFGALFWLLMLPAKVLALIILCAQKDASLLSYPLVPPPLHALWDWQVFGIVLLWLLLQALLSLLPVGKVVRGMPLKNGQTLEYRINGLYALLVSAVAAGTAVYYYKVDLTYVHAHFLQFYTSALLIATLLSIYLYVRSRRTAADQLAPAGNSGYFFYDFFMGRELNPRIKNFDIKFFCEMRPGLIGWLVINFSMLLAEMKQQNLDAPSTAMILVNCLQLLWVADGFWHEEKLLGMMDIVYDGFGFMLAFGDLVWVPFVFTCQAHYLVHHPSDLSAFWVVAICLLNAIGYYIFRKSNSQKFAFRRNPSDPSLSHLKTILSGSGKSLLASGLWGFVRHPNYLGDILMGLAWSLTCGFNHVIPYFYLIYLILLLVHREARDEGQCRKKHGSAWEDYCKAVRYRIFPGIY